MNYAQFSDIDVDLDGDQDLFVFDRSSDNIRIFLNEVNGTQHSYKFLYKGSAFFPSDLRYRATALDYDSDGDDDLFVYGIGGIKVYRNVSTLAGGIQWEVAKNLLYSDYNGANLNLYVSSADIPAIVDVDADGDVDVLTFHIGGQHMQYHQNQSQELSYGNDSLIFVLKNECWGKFREDLNTSTIFLNDNSSPCTTGNVPNPEFPLPGNISPERKPTEQMPKHSGSTILALDIDNSGVIDLILGDVAFSTLNLLINGGTDVNQNSAMISQDNSFPSNSLPVNMNLFPAPFWVDVDFDSKKDLIVGANAKNISQNESSVLFYRNAGSNDSPIFVYQTDAFLQKDMIEHGTGSIPVFMDFDQDGLEDLFVSSFYRYKPTLNKECGISYYRNTGTLNDPFFTLIDNDLLNLSTSSNGLRMVPTFGDLDGDGDKDLLLGLENGSLTYYPNVGTPPVFSFGTPITNLADNNAVVINAGQYATPQLFDLNNDGLLDLIIGKKTGEMLYYENTGTTSSPIFQLKNDTLGNIDVATSTPDGFPVPHFFRHNDTTWLFLGAVDGQLHFYKDIDGNLNSGASFTLVSDDFLGIEADAYSAFWVNDIDNDGLLNLFVGQDLGGLYHMEDDPNSQAAIDELPEQLEYSLYPNPANSSITVSGIYAGQKEIRVLDLFGKMILSERSSSLKTIIDLSRQPSGIYIIQIYEESGRQATFKIIKQSE